MQQDGCVGLPNNYMTGLALSAPYTSGTTSFAGGGAGIQKGSYGTYSYAGGTKVFGGGDDMSPRSNTIGASNYFGSGNAGKDTTDGGSGLANSGGGGGGNAPGSHYSNTSYTGGNGGSGVVVLRWVTEA
jgi:hypothetical protein